jgi:hypothetical protein
VGGVYPRGEKAREAERAVAHHYSAAYPKHLPAAAFPRQKRGDKHSLTNKGSPPDFSRGSTISRVFFLFTGAPGCPSALGSA